MSENISNIRNSNDYISDAIDALYAGNVSQAQFSLKEAMEAKLTNHFCNCLADVYDVSTSQ